jgi:hypothetical protein
MEGFDDFLKKVLRGSTFLTIFWEHKVEKVE